MNTPLKRIGIIGDVHQEDRTLQLVLEQLPPVDLVLCTGDIADGAGDFGRCCRLLRDREVAVVLGNHDRWLLAGQMRDLPDALPVAAVSSEDRRYLASLPPMREYETPLGLLMLCHGIGRNDMAALLPDDSGYALEANTDLHRLLAEHRCSLVIGGHSHQRTVRSLGALTYVNAGTLRGDHSPCFALADFERRLVQLWGIQGGSGSELAERYAL